MGHNKILLVDVKKAFDSVNLHKLESMITENLPTNTHIILLNIISLYKQLQIDLYGFSIVPEQGVPQGDTFACLFFNFYIDPVLKEVSQTYSNLRTQAYADDIEIQGSQTAEIELAFNLLEARFNEIGLNLNLSKCDLISAEPSDFITSRSGVVINSVTHAKYLGQIIDSSGIPKIDINNKTFGKLIDILSKNNGLAIIARIKIFKIYMRSKLNHLIPLICTTNQTEVFWEILRKIIFKQILLRTTLPREAASLFKCGPSTL